MPLRVVHVVHDYLPRHQAGSELYVAALCAEQRALGQHPTVFAATFAPGQRQGDLRWRTHAGVPVVEVVNNWDAADFPETYDAAWLQAAFGQVLDAAEPQVVHVHNLLNLSFGLPAVAGAREIPVVATLHDYTLVCPSGGQRIHKSEAHVCRRIEPARCARCFADSPFHAQWQFGRVSQALPGGIARRLAAGIGRLPPLTRAAHALSRVHVGKLAPEDIDRRLDAARQVFSDFQRVVAPSRSVADEYRALGFPVDRLEVSDYGFARLEAARTPRSDNARLRIGFMGTLVWHKGVDVLVEAARLLPPDRVTVCIHGDEHVFPQYTAELRARAAGLPIEFRGRFDHEDVATVLGGLDVLVVPSRWLENSPLVIHEAFMARLPVVASAIGGIPDLLGGGSHGVLVPPDDAEALAGALRELIESPDRLRDLSARSPAVKTIAGDAAEWAGRYESVMREAAGARAAS